jgi:Phospholipase_D-nuclease N-terminal
MEGVEMSWIWPILAVLVIVLWTLAVINIVRFRHTMSGVKIVAWLIAIVVFPVLGAIAYFLVHGTSGPPAAPRDPEIGDRLPDA